MNTESTTQFIQSIYREHLAEASFLYDQRAFLLNDPEFEWPDWERFEDRFEAHIDALAAGGDESLDVCVAACTGKDAGEMHAALRVFCRSRRFDLLRAALETIAPQNSEALDAAGLALAADMPPDRAKDWLNLICMDCTPVIAVAARVMAQRRLDMGQLFIPFLNPGTNTATLHALVHAAGRLPYGVVSRAAAIPGLSSVLAEHPEPRIKQAAALALLRLGETHILDICRVHARKNESWPLLPLGLGGATHDAALLLETAAKTQHRPDLLTALGLLGDIRAVPFLLNQLENEDRQAAAAQALWLITGAELCEQVCIPVQFSVDELFDDEQEQLARGEFTPPENMRGSTITRISQNPADWRNWWTENSKRFDASLRYRNGLPYSPKVLLDILNNPKTPHAFRTLALEELAIRYRIDAPFETNQFVAAQRQTLATLASLVKNR